MRRSGTHSLALFALVLAMEACRPQARPAPEEPDSSLISVVPPEAPDSVPRSLLGPSHWVRNPAHSSVEFVRDMVIIRFARGASQAERQAAIDLIKGTVVGGLRFEGMEGAYYVRLRPDSTNEAVFAAIAMLQRLSQIEDALPNLITDDGWAPPPNSDP